MRRPVYKIILLLLCGLTADPAPAASAAARHLLYKAIQSFKQEDYGAAKLTLEKVLELEPKFAEAYVLKGLLHYHDNQPEQANAAMDYAHELNPRLAEQMRNELEKKAHAVESSLTKQAFSHFDLQFHGAGQREQAWQAVQHLNETYQDLGSRFGLFPEKRLSVIIFTSDEFSEAWDAPMWMGGFYDTRDGQIRIRINEPPGGKDEYRRRLRHEYTHAYLHYLTKKDMPVWFHEGVAQFYSYASPSDGFWKSNRLEELRKLTRNVPWMDFDTMEGSIRYKNVHPLQIYMGYVQAEALVLYVAKERGESWIPAVLQRVRSGKSFEAAFQEVVGVEPARMLENVRRLIS